MKNKVSKTHKKSNIYKKLTLLSIIAVSILAFFKWFTISAVGTVEAHSFITIPAMLNEGAGFITRIGGKTVAIVVLIGGAVLEYMCIMASVLGIWGSIRSLKSPCKSGMIFISQIIFMTLETIAFMAILLINVVSRSALGGALGIMPTPWLVVSLIFLSLSFYGGSKFPGRNEMENKVSN